MTTNKDYTQRVEEIRGRINEELMLRGISQNQVAGGEAATQKRINAQLSHGANLTVDTLLRVLDALPGVTADQLLRDDRIEPIGVTPRITIARDGTAAVHIAPVPDIKIENQSVLRELNNVVITHTQAERKRAAIRRLAGGGVDLDKTLHRTAVTTRKKGPKDFGSGSQLL